MIAQHETELRVRYDETDPMGYVHHANYLRYLEIGRTDLLRASGGSYRDMEATGEMVVVVEIGCKYKMPAKYDDVINIKTMIVKVTAAKILHEYEIWRGEQLLFTAALTLAVINRDGQLQRVPDWLLEKYGVQL